MDGDGGYSGDRAKEVLQVRLRETSGSRGEEEARMGLQLTTFLLRNGVEGWFLKTSFRLHFLAQRLSLGLREY